MHSTPSSGAKESDPSKPAPDRSALTFRCLTATSVKSVTFRPQALVIAGWAGRDPASMEEHIRELEEIGVARPRAMPMFYRVAAGLLTTAGRIEVVGGDSSGEAETILAALEDGLWIGVGSDHTDRRLETVGVALSKQVCPKPISDTLWRYEDVADHWDSLLLRSYITVDDERRLYQEGSLSTLLTPQDLLRRYRQEGQEFGPGSVMFGGTMPVRGGLHPSSLFEAELEDPVLGRSIKYNYTVGSLPIVE